MQSLIKEKKEVVNEIRQQRSAMYPFMYALKSSEARRQYSKRLKMLFDFLSLPGSLEEQAKEFLEKARQIIQELASTNPVYYEKLRERLEKIIEEEEKRRFKDATYFNKLKEVYNEALNSERERKKLGFSTQFEFAVYELILQFPKNDKNTSRIMTNAIFAKVREEARIVGWKTKRSSEKRMSIAIYDILAENDNFSADKVNDLTTTIIDLAKKDL